MMKLHLGTLLVICLLSLTEGTRRPIIGILTQELSSEYIKLPQYSSFISAAYVKSVEAAGARVVPIFINQTKEYYREIVASVNGALFPGGSSSFKTRGGFADAAREILQNAKEVNKRGGYFPLMAVCLGFELLFYLEIGTDYRVPCSSLENVGLPLDFALGYRQSSLFGPAPSNIIQILKTKPVTANFHSQCLLKSVMKESGMKNWKVLSTNRGDSNTTFLSSIESIEYPFAGIQFHPERNVYDWKEQFTHLKTPDGLAIQRFFYDWLIKESRKNSHKFSNQDDETKSLISNFPSMYVGDILIYDEIFVFK